MLKKVTMITVLLGLLMMAMPLNALTQAETFPIKIELGLGHQEGIVDNPSRHIGQYFTGLLNCRVTWVKPLPKGTIIRFVWSQASGNNWSPVLDLKVEMDGTQDVAFSKVFRTGSAPMKIGYWSVTIYINNVRLDSMIFLVK